MGIPLYMTNEGALPCGPPAYTTDALPLDPRTSRGGAAPQTRAYPIVVTIVFFALLVKRSKGSQGFKYCKGCEGSKGS